MQIQLTEEQFNAIVACSSQIKQLTHKLNNDQAFRDSLVARWEGIVSNMYSYLNGVDFANAVSKYEAESGKSFNWEIIDTYIIARNGVSSAIAKSPEFFGVYSINTNSPEHLDGVAQYCQLNLMSTDFEKVSDVQRNRPNFVTLWASLMLLINTKPQLSVAHRNIYQALINFMRTIPVDTYIETLDGLIQWQPEAKELYLAYIRERIENGLFDDIIQPTAETNVLQMNFDAWTFVQFIENIMASINKAMEEINAEQNAEQNA